MQKGFFRRFFPGLVEVIAPIFECIFNITKKFLNRVDPDVLEEISNRKTLEIFRGSAKTVPAYTSFLKKSKIDFNEIRGIEDFDKLVPITTKENYIKRYSYEDRCRYGKLPEHGSIDESSGSSGIPTEWVRSVEENARLNKDAEFEYFYTYKPKNKNYILIGAWSLGAWATGIRFAELVEKFSLVKSTGPDVEKIIDTLKIFGNKYNYLIAGYPPFLKTLIDEGKKKINWKDYKVDFVTGGEGFVEAWRDYMKKNLNNPIIISSYGCSDVDIGIAFETPLSTYIRKRCDKDKRLKKFLFVDDSRLPMIFQYDPIQHHIQNTTRRIGRKKVQEFYITLLDKNVVSPKIKYNVRDEGGKYSFNEITNKLLEYDEDFINDFINQGGIEEDILHLPFLYVYGRSDGTISIDGANVYPEQIDLSIKRDKELSKITSSFKIKLDYDSEKNVRFFIFFELDKDVKFTRSLESKYHDVIVRNLCEINRDFEESYLKDKKVVDPVVEVYNFGEGPFVTEKERIKHQYIITGREVLNYVLLSIFLSVVSFISIGNMTSYAIFENLESGKLALLFFLVPLAVFIVVILIVYYIKLKKMKVI